MVVPVRYILFISVTLTWMGLMYTSRNYLSPRTKKFIHVQSDSCLHSAWDSSQDEKENENDEKRQRTEDKESLVVTAIAPRVWEKFPNETWRGLPLPVFTAEPWARLGNVMGEYASLYALGRAYNVTVRLHPDMKRYLYKIFPNLSMPLLPGEFVKPDWTPVGGITYRNYARIEVAASGLLGPRLFLVQEWPFEIPLFNSFRKEILRELTFAPSVMAAVREFIDEKVAKIRKNDTSEVVLVGVHIRRTDYLDFIRTSYKSHVPGLKYYERAMDYYRKKYPNVIFMVGSDDMEFVKDHFGALPDVFLGPDSTREIDMAALASCNHSIISLGSFGFWTGYLAGGEVVYPNISFPVQYQFSGEWYRIAKLEFFTPIAAD